MSDQFEPGPQMDDCDIICPYCGKSFQAEAEDADETPKETECSECGKTFIQYASISVDYCTQPKETK